MLYILYKDHICKNSYHAEPICKDLQMQHFPDIYAMAMWKYYYILCEPYFTIILYSDET